MKSLAVICLLPSTAWADWSPQPMNFDYGHAYGLCSAAQADPVAACRDALSAAYTLRREITLAVLPCLNSTGCTTALTAAGLPADVWEAEVDAGCDTSLQTLPGWENIPYDTPLSDTHCIEQMAQQIERTNLPFNHDQSISCGIMWIECGELAHLSETYWYFAALGVDLATQDAPDPQSDWWAQVSLEQVEEVQRLCQEVSSGGWGETLERADCRVARYAEIARS